MINAVDSIRKINADRLISITSISKGGENTLYYHFAFDRNPKINEFTIKVPKGENVESIISLFQNAALLEAEVTELFGIKFKGNEYSGKRLFQAEEGGGPVTCSLTGSFRVKNDA